jgi:hypothetical protein
VVEPPNPDKVCTVASVAAHSLYEKADPYLQHLPGGAIDLRGTRFEQVTPRAVRISGTRFVAAPAYTLELEGAARAGYRTLAIAGTRDPVLLRHLDAYLDNVRQRVGETYPDGYRLLFHVYGRDGVMGAREPERAVRGHEVGIVFEVVATTRQGRRGLRVHHPPPGDGGRPAGAVSHRARRGGALTPAEAVPLTRRSRGPPGLASSPSPVASRQPRSCACATRRRRVEERRPVRSHSHVQRPARTAESAHSMRGGRRRRARRGRPSARTTKRTPRRSMSTGCPRSAAFRISARRSRACAVV